MSKEREVKFTLLENGLDFIQSALDHLNAASTKRDLKYAVLHLSAGIELVLKERLRREHWSLVFEDTDKADMTAYDTGDFTSATLTSCLTRLRGICGVDLNEREQQELLRFRRKRNRLEHFNIVDSIEAIVASSARVLEILLEFVNEELEPDEVSKEEAVLMGKIRARLGELEAFVEKRSKSIEGALKRERRTVAVCPACSQEALALDDEVECHFCGHRAAAEGAARDYVTRILGKEYYRVTKDGGTWPISDCPECRRGTLVDSGASGGAAPAVQFMCFACGTSWEEGALKRCSWCNEFYRRGDDDIGMCNDCFLTQSNRE